MDKDALSLLKDLSLAFGVAGTRAKCARAAARAPSPPARASSRIGSAASCSAGRTARPAARDDPGHMDEIGFMVKLIDEKGFLRFITLGGWFDQNVLSQRVLVRNRQGRRARRHRCKPPHLLDAKERDKVVELKTCHRHWCQGQEAGRVVRHPSRRSSHARWRIHRAEERQDRPSQGARRPWWAA